MDQIAITIGPLGNFLCEKNAKPSALTIRMLDLSLFRVFADVKLHRSVRKASQILSVTPSTVSHALNRMRQAICDELFIPGAFGMQQTRRALEFAAAVHEGLENFEFALTAKLFVPAEAVRLHRCRLRFSDRRKRRLWPRPYLDWPFEHGCKENGGGN